MEAPKGFNSLLMPGNPSTATVSPRRRKRFIQSTDLFTQLRVLGTSPAPCSGQAVRPRAAGRRLPSSVFWARAGMGDNNSIPGVEPIEPNKILPPSRC